MQSEQIKGYLIKGIGWIIGKEEQMLHNSVVVNMPVIVLNGLTPDGRKTYTLQILAAEFLEDCSKVDRKVLFRKEDIIIHQRVSSKMASLYTQYRNSVIESRSGLVLPAVSHIQ